MRLLAASLKGKGVLSEGFWELGDPDLIGGEGFKCLEFEDEALQTCRYNCNN